MKNDIVKTYCSDCSNDTNHSILFSKVNSRKLLEEAGDYIEEVRYAIIECMGCDRTSFLETTSTSNDLGPDDLPLLYNHNYPEELDTDDQFLTFEHLYSLPKMIRDMYEEVTNAFENESKILAGIGLRTLAEATCINQKIAGKTLYDKIKNLKEDGHISNNSFKVLLELKDIGNTSAHEIKSPSWDILFHALEVINQTLREIYIMPKLYKRMAAAKNKKK